MDIIKVVFNPLLNFANFRKVKSLFLQKKLNIDPQIETERITRDKKDPIVVPHIDPIDLDEQD